MTRTGQMLNERSFAFALRVVKLAQQLSVGRQEYVLSKQLLRSGTGIGANIRESIFAQSTADYVSKLSIALKEASETQYWLELLYAAEYVTDDQFASLKAEVDWLVGTLVNTVKANKRKLNAAAPLNAPSALNGPSGLNAAAPLNAAARLNAPSALN